MTVLRNFIDFRKMRSSVARVTFGSRSFIRASEFFFPLLFYALLLLILMRTMAVCFIWTAGLCHCLCNNAIIMSDQ